VKIKNELKAIKIDDEKINASIDSAIKMVADDPNLDLSLSLNIFS
jgi:hypothetical protein